MDTDLTKTATTTEKDEQFTQQLQKSVDTETFRLYAGFLARENQKYNLTALSENETPLKHFVDSATAVELLPRDAELCDIGSGAGFPAMVLKILRPDLDVTLLDAVEKKARFLRALAETLAIDEGIEIKHCRAEQEAASNREGYDVVTARAVAPLPTLLEYAIPLLKIGGIFIAYKGAGFEAERQNAKTAERLLGAELNKIIKYSLSERFDRALLVYKKATSTPDRYPRKNNNPRRRPL